MADSHQLSDSEIRRVHRRARSASIDDWRALGAEHGHEDALACVVGLSLHDGTTVHALQRQRMADRRRRLDSAGISDDRIAAWLEAHTSAFAAHMAEISRRGPLQTSGGVIAVS